MSVALLVKYTSRSFSEMWVALFPSLMSENSSQLGTPLMLTTGMALTLMACVQVPVLVSNSIVPFVL